MSHIYRSPRHYNETIFTQGERLEKELEEARLHHAVTVGKQALRRFQNRRFGGNSFDALTATTMIYGELQLEGIAPELIPTLTDLIVGQYLRS